MRRRVRDKDVSSTSTELRVMDLGGDHMIWLHFSFISMVTMATVSLEVHHSLQSAPDWLRPVLLRVMMAPAQLG